MTCESKFRRLALCLAAWVVLLLPRSAALDPPRIGLVYATSHLEALRANGDDHQLRYRQAIEEQGGTIVVLGQSDPPEKLAGELATLDGVLLPGGIDIDPKHYGEERHPKLEKTDETLDEMQFTVLRYAREHALPVLGVCLGHQTINVFYGGSLYQDIPSQLNTATPVTHRGGTPPTHALDITQGSLLAEMLSTREIDVNSIHHQGIKRLADGFTATAHTADGLIEAIEHQGKPFILGVQFHPEIMIKDEPRMKAIFARLVREARNAGRGDNPFMAFLPDPETVARLQPVIDQLESEAFAERETASRTLKALPALPGFVRELALKEQRPESRARLLELVAAFPLDTENARLTRLLEQIEANAAKGRLDPIIRVMQPGVWSPASKALHGAARATATSADLPLITRCLKDPAPVIRRIAAAALGGLPPDEADPLLVGLLDDADAPTAFLAASALAARKDTRCLPTFARLLDAADFPTRYQCHSALRSLTGKDFGYDPSLGEEDRKLASGKWRRWAAAADAVITGSLPRDSTIALFNDENLQGWAVFFARREVLHSPAWEVKDGAIHCNGKEPGDLWTTTRHENYVLTLEYMCAAADSDSGVGLLLTEAEERGADGPGYLEVQLLPGKVGDIYQIGGIHLEAHGKPVQFLCPRAAEVPDPPGKWHKLKLTVRDGAAEVEADGVLVNCTDKGPRGPGRIVFRNEGKPVSFRSILLHPL